MTSIAARTGPRRLLAVVLVVAVLALAVLGARTLVERRRAADARADPALSAAVSAVIPGLEAFVEAARGLKFLSPVKISVLADAAFRKKYDSGGGSGSGGSDSSARTLRVLGLDDTAGGGQASSGSGGGSDAVEYRYVATLSPEEQREAAAEDGSTPTDQSDPFAELDDFPYDDGPTFIAALVAAGGQAAVDDAFRHPPTTSAEILHPERYLAGKGRAPVPDVVAGGRVVDQGVIGEYLLGLVLEETVPRAEAEQAAAGWAGDRYVTWRSGRRSCVRATVVFDTPTDAGELTTALQRWAATHAGTSVGAAGPAAVTLDRCA